MDVDFIALDLETATYLRSSICEIGLAFVKNGKVVDSKSWLVQPQQNLYDDFNIYIHGITPEMTENSPSFQAVWDEVKQIVKGKTIVSHNTSFDMYALKDAFDLYGIAYPVFDYYCSLRISRKAFPGLYSYSLPDVCNAIGIEFNQHHRAKGDAVGCAEVFLKSIERLGVNQLDELPELLKLRKGSFNGKDHIPQRQKDISYSKTNLNEYIKSLSIDESKIDPDNYFYGKSVCFTGAFSFAVRKELLAKMAELGAIPMNSVTKETNILVVGQQDYRVVGDSGMSSKQKKAMSLIDKGQELEIMSESEFLTNSGLNF